jgi:hypothetical protein
VTRKPKTPIPDIKAHPELTRAIMHCDIGRSSLNCEIAPPAGCTSLEWATYNLLCAVGEIAAAMMKAEKADGGASC